MFRWNSDGFRRLTFPIGRATPDTLSSADFLEAVAANIKGVVQRPLTEGNQPKRKRMKPVLTLLEIVALLAAGFTFYKFAGDGARLGSRASPSAIPENASPTGEELMRTPELGLEFWQRDQKNLMFATQGEKRITRVLLKRAPFEIRCPHFEAAVRICAWSDASIFDAILAAKKRIGCRKCPAEKNETDIKLGKTVRRETTSILQHKGFFGSKTAQAQSPLQAIADGVYV